MKQEKDEQIINLKQKCKILEETSGIDEDLISAVVASPELPSTNVNDDEPALDESSCINYPCEKCDFDFDEEDDLDAHNEIYHENRCDICDIDFEEEAALQTHKGVFHQSVSRICDVDFAEEDTLNNHKEIHDDKRCDECDFGSTTEKGLKIHKGMKHKQPIIENYTFDQCK